LLQYWQGVAYVLPDGVPAHHVRGLASFSS
jgi:hypothetical protein